jgi:hypothetical protein
MRRGLAKVVAVRNNVLDIILTEGWIEKELFNDVHGSFVNACLIISANLHTNQRTLHELNGLRIRRL